MSDRELQRALRRWRDTGSSEDEAVYLRERLRSGELAQERLLLAAYLGHPAAGVALGDSLGELSELEAWLSAQGLSARVDQLEGWIRDWCDAEVAFHFSHLAAFLAEHAEEALEAYELAAPPHPPPAALSERLFARWVRGLAAWGPLIEVRAAWAIASACLAALPECALAPLAAEALDRVAAWLVCPCSSHRRATQELLPLRIVPLEGPPEHVAAAEALCELAQCAQHTDPRYLALVLARTVDAGVRALLGGGALGDAGAERIRRILATELLPWALDGVEIDPASVSALREEVAQAEELRGRRSRGELAEWELELLARAGHPAARIAAGATGRYEPDLEAWARAGAALGRRAAEHVATAAARGARGPWGELRPDDPRLGRALAAARGGSQEGERVAARIRELEAAQRELSSGGALANEACAACLGAARAALLACSSEEDPTWAVVDAVAQAKRALRLAAQHDQQTLTETELDERLRDAILLDLAANLLPAPAPPAS